VRRIGEIRLPFDHPPGALERAVRRLGVRRGERWVVLRKSLDARRKDRIRWVYAIGVEEPDGRPPRRPIRRREPPCRPVIVGSGPAGLFAAYWLALGGVRSLVLEQGEPMPDRLRTMARFMRRGELDPRSNLCFGAGGAGAYSDGKLGTRIRSPHVPFVMETFVELGAPEEVRYLASPHLGSNLIRRLIQRLIERLGELGVEVRFRAAVASLALRDGAVEGVVLESGEDVASGHVLLAVGHSARPLFRELERLGVPLEAKPFAVGARLEHPAAHIARVQYGPSAGHPALPPATYRLARTWRTAEGERAVYSFCMCPGGYVLNTATEPDGVVSNGMSNRGCRGRFSNAAFVVNVRLDDLPAAGGALGGVAWQREIEVAAAAAANPGGGCHALPAQRLVEFLEGRRPGPLPPTSCPSPVRPVAMEEILPGFVTEALRRGLVELDRKMRGLIHPEAVLVGPETRTSSPVRIVRDRESRQSVGVRGLYPVGEGAGYAGGITSAAVDGIASAEAILRSLPRAR